MYRACQGVRPHWVPADSFNARLGAAMEQLFTDGDLAQMYGLDNGRPSLPRSLLSGIPLLQFYEPHPRWCRCDVSDAETIARLAFHLR